MDPVTASALISAGSSLVSSIFGGRAAKKRRRQSKQDAENKFVDLRRAAVKGGFNPLTALGLTGGAGFGAFPSSAFDMSSTVDDVAGAFLGFIDAKTQARDEAGNEKAVAANNQLGRRSPEPAARVFDDQQIDEKKPLGWSGNAAGLGNFMLDVYKQHQNTVPVVLPDKSAHRISPAQADALGVQPFAALTVGDLSTLFGHNAGEDFTKGRGWSMQLVGALPTQYDYTRPPALSVPFDNAKSGLQMLRDNIFGQYIPNATSPRSRYRSEVHPLSPRAGY